MSDVREELRLNVKNSDHEYEGDWDADPWPPPKHSYFNPVCYCAPKNREGCPPKVQRHEDSAIREQLRLNVKNSDHEYEGDWNADPWPPPNHSYLNPVFRGAPRFCYCCPPKVQRHDDSDVREELSLNVRDKYDWDVTGDPYPLPNASSFNPVLYQGSRNLRPPGAQRRGDDDTWWWSTSALPVPKEDLGEGDDAKELRGDAKYFSQGKSPPRNSHADEERGDHNEVVCPTLSPTRDHSEGSLSAPSEYFSLESSQEDDSKVSESPLTPNAASISICPYCDQVTSGCCRELADLRSATPPHDSRTFVVATTAKSQSLEFLYRSPPTQSQSLPGTEIAGNRQRASSLECDSTYHLTKESLERLEALLPSEDTESIISDLDEYMEEIVELIERGTSPARFSTFPMISDRATSAIAVETTAGVSIGVQTLVELRETGTQTEAIGQAIILSCLLEGNETPPIIAPAPLDVAEAPPTIAAAPPAIAAAPLDVAEAPPTIAAAPLDVAEAPPTIAPAPPASPKVAKGSTPSRIPRQRTSRRLPSFIPATLRIEK